MATIKSYTDIEQSKKLSEIIPIESADMYYEPSTGYCTEPSEAKFGDIKYAHPRSIRCWSLTALLDVLPFHLIVNNQRYAFSMHKGLNKNGETYMFRYNIFNTDICLYETEYYNSPIDACYEMIIKLHELNLL